MKFNMNKYINSITGVLGAALLLTSCGDFLDPKSQSEFVPKDVTSLNEILLGEAYPRNDMGGFNYFLTMMDDDVTAAAWQETDDNYDENIYLASYTWQPDMFEIMKTAGVTRNDMYYTYYRKLKGVNAVLDYIGTVTGSDDDMNNVQAQAYALRGFYYFNLVNIFGQPYNYNPDALGVPLKLRSGVEENLLTRNKVKEVYDQIVKDLLQAEKLYERLPVASQWKTNYRTSLPMVQLLLSRTYLYMEKWEEAAIYAKKVMDNTKFQLLDLNTVPTETTEDGRTTRTYINYHSFASSPEVIWPYGQVSDWAGWVESYATENSSGAASHTYFQASQDLLDSYEPTDLRYDRYIVRKPFGLNDTIPLAIGKLNVNNAYRPTGGTGVFGRSMRLSEAYLNYMEAEAMLYKTTGSTDHLQLSLNALNNLRQKRFAPDDYKAVNITDADKLVEFIHNERRRELCFESQRWYDLRRWGMPEIKHIWYDSKSTVTTYTLKEKDPLYTVPIPDEAIEKNIRLEQNPLCEKRVGVTSKK